MTGITRTTRLGLFALGFLTATGVEAVRADEAYLCEDGRIVKVAPGKLEDLKRTDACIAAYYGLTIGTAPRLENKGLETGAIAPPGPRTAAPSVAVDAPLRPAPTAKSAPQKPELTTAAKAAPIAPRAATGTDYRNVVLLNATPGEAAIFRHER